MPHVLELSTALQTELYSAATAPIVSKVIMRGKVETPVSTNTDGTINFSGSEIHEFEVTDRLDRESPLRISSQRPELPGNDGTETQSSNVTITLINTDTYMSSLQTGAKISPATVQHVEFDIYASINGQDLLMYRGRSIGHPAEHNGLTVFTLRDTLWEAINLPVQCPMISTDQDLYADSSGALNVSWHLFGGMYFFDAYGYFNSTGQITPAFDVSDKTKVDLFQVDFPLGAYPLGKWEIEFTGPTIFEFRSPLLEPEIGNVLSPFVSATGVSIPQSYWNYVPGTDLTGSKLSFNSYFSARGNPITIIKALLEWGLNDSWGSALTEPAYLPVNWTALTELEDYYSGVEVYVSETNKDNKVFDEGKPISVKRVVEMIAGHVLAFPTFDSEGKFTLISNQIMPSRFAYEINSDMIISHSLIGSKKYNKLTVAYGYDDQKGNYYGREVYQDSDITNYTTSLAYTSGSIVTFQGITYYCKEDNPAGSFDRTKWSIYRGESHTINLKYFKVAASLAQIQSVGPVMWDRLQSSVAKIEAVVISQFGVSLEAGDKVYFNLTEQPEFAGYFELTNVSKSPGENANVKGVLIPFGNYQKPGVWCEGFFCNGVYCF